MKTQKEFIEAVESIAVWNTNAIRVFGTFINLV